MSVLCCFVSLIKRSRRWISAITRVFFFGLPKFNQLEESTVSKERVSSGLELLVFEVLITAN